ncbi:MAG: GxxExxY protein [Saprospiraceae bacterium]|nr:GxxExxY protein [Saprospiraceae bacterium]
MARFSKEEINHISYEIIGAAIEVHKELGPGLLESIYHQCMVEELVTRHLRVETEKIIPLRYKSKKLTTNLRCDLFVEDLIVVELKAVETMLPIFTAQILSYMRLLKVPKGILINFNVENIFREGQKTFVNDHFRNLPD